MKRNWIFVALLILLAFTGAGLFGQQNKQSSSTGKVCARRAAPISGETAARFGSLSPASTAAMDVTRATSSRWTRDAISNCAPAMTASSTGWTMTR